MKGGPSYGLAMTVNKDRPQKYKNSIAKEQIARQVLIENLTKHNSKRLIFHMPINTKIKLAEDVVFFTTLKVTRV